jgi:hypothetical protein
MTDDAFAQRAAAARREWGDARTFVVGPFERYLAALGANQPWSMFSTPNRTPTRFVVEASRDGAWFFVSGVPSGAWRASFFDSERVRSFLNAVARDRAWSLADDFCDRIAQDALRANTEWTRMRCTFTSAPSASWRAPSVSEPHVDWQREVAR